LLNLQASIKA